MELVGEELDFLLHFLHLDGEDDCHFLVNFVVAIHGHRADLRELIGRFILFAGVLFLVLAGHLLDGREIVVWNIELDDSE